ncbi:CapA family protein [bacterium]|nr:CapA family protein [bacterium]
MEKKKRIKFLLLYLLLFILFLILFFWILNIKITNYRYSLENLSSPEYSGKDVLDETPKDLRSRSEHLSDINQSMNKREVASLFGPKTVFKEESNSDIVTLVSTGDYMTARSVNSKAISKNDFSWVVENLAETLNKADITLINLETPLVSTCPTTDEGMVFCGSPQNTEGLVLAGVDVVNLANNHASDYGLSGMNETVSILQEKSIKPFGIKSLPATLVTLRGIRFGFIGFNDVGNYSSINAAEIENVENQISIGVKESDVLIVSFHWGEEYTDKVTQRQKVLAHLAIDSGATVVIGNHPHWIQPAEFYKDKLILYAQGNFIFDQLWSEKTKEGVVAKLSFSGKDLVDVEFIPTYIVDYGQVTVPSNDKYNQIIENFKNISIVHENNLRR